MAVTIQHGTYRKDWGGGHQYYIDDQKTIGVTTILSNGFPKPGLVKWAGNTVAEFAVDNWRTLSKMPISQRLKELNKAPWTDRDGAGRLGTRIHGIAEAINNGEDVTIPEEIVGYLNSYRRFLKEWNVEPIATELPVFNRKYMYGGTIDLIGKLRSISSMVDIKSGRSHPFGEVALQLAGYAFAEFTLDENNNEIVIPKVEQYKIVWVQPEFYEVIPVSIDKRMFNNFLSVKAVAEITEESRYYLGDSEE